MDYPDYLQLIPDYDPVATAEDCTFDAEIAQLAIDFFAEELCLIEGVPGYPAFVLEDWQKAIIANLFGWLRPDGTRRYTEAFLMIPRKNGKTPLMAGVINHVAYNEDEPGGQIYSSAGEKNQAALIFRHVAGMIQRNPELDKRAKIYKTYKSAEFYGGDCIYNALSADANTKHGQNAHLIINDELHVHKTRDLIDTLETSTASRKQPLVIHITTAGYDKETICYEKYDYACKVRDGVINDSSFLPVIYEIKQADYDRWDDPVVWEYCNPNLGISVNRDYLEKQCQKAKAIPAKENTFRRLHLNQWTEQECRWLSVKAWQDCNVELRSDNGIIWIGGLDLSTTTDLTAFTALGFDSLGNLHWHSWPFIPKDNATKREHQDGVPYLTWARQGKITLTDGNVVDYNVIQDHILKMHQIYNFAEIAYDPYNATQMILNLQDKGIECTPYGQGIKNISPPCKALEALLLAGKIAHDDHPVLNWCVSNVTVKQDENENIKPVKPKNFKRIDIIVAGLMALGRLITENHETQESIYEERDPFTF